MYSIAADASVCDLEPLLQVITTAMGVVAVHHRGRKPLLVTSSAICGVSLVALGVFFRMKDAGQDVSAIEWLPLTSIIVFLLGFATGFGPIGYLFMGEMTLTIEFHTDGGPY